MKQDVMERLLIAKSLGADQFQSWLVAQIDEIDDKLEQTNNAELEAYYKDRKEILNEVRDAYVDIVVKKIV